jgi:hypothetical protein
MWKDKWTKPLIKHHFPQLLSFSNDHDITVREACAIAEDGIYEHCPTPLYMIASI